MKKEKIIRLNKAENGIVENLYSKNLRLSLFTYPDPLSLDLRKEIGKYVGFKPSWIGCGNGSDELIDLLIAIFVKSGEEIIICPPTFPMYEFFGRNRGVKVKKVFRDKNLEVDIVKVISKITKNTKLIFIDAPGNPTGSLIKRKALIELLGKKIIVVVDEAYFEYCNQTVASLIKKFPNLIVLRSFSKWAGLAGLRIGYMIARPSVIKAFNLKKPIYNVNSVAQELAISALNNKEKILKRMKNELFPMRDYIAKRFSVFPNLKITVGNGPYVALKINNINCELIAEKLKQRGIIIKVVNQHLMENYFLISVAPYKEMKKVIDYLCLIIKKLKK